MPEVNTKKKLTRALKPITIKVAMVPKARACSVEVEEIEDEDSARNINARNSGISPTSSFQISGTKKNSKSAGRNVKRSLLQDRHQWACRIFFSRNIFMPGSAEQVFSGGTPHAGTIRILMLVKKRLHLARARANAALCC